MNSKTLPINLIDKEIEKCQHCGEERYHEDPCCMNCGKDWPSKYDKIKKPE